MTRPFPVNPAHPERTVTVSGQVEVASTHGTVSGISLDPVDPAACPAPRDPPRAQRLQVSVRTHLGQLGAEQFPRSIWTDGGLDWCHTVATTRGAPRGGALRD